MQVFGQHKTYSIEPEPGIGRELYWHQPANVFSRGKFYVLNNPLATAQPLYWHRKNPFDAPKWYILERIRPPVPENVIGGGWFNPPDDGQGLDLERIKKDDRDFLNILIMAIHGINRL